MDSVLRRDAENAFQIKSNLKLISIFGTYFSACGNIEFMVYFELGVRHNAARVVPNCFKVSFL